MDEEKSTTTKPPEGESKASSVMKKVVGYVLLGLLAATLIGAIVAKH